MSDATADFDFRWAAPGRRARHPRPGRLGGHARRGGRAFRPRAGLLPRRDHHGRPVRRAGRPPAARRAAGRHRLPRRAPGVRERAGENARATSGRSAWPTGYRGRWLVQRATPGLREAGAAGPALLRRDRQREPPRARSSWRAGARRAACTSGAPGGLTTCAILLRPRGDPRAPGRGCASPASAASPAGGRGVPAAARARGASSSRPTRVEDFTGGDRSAASRPEDIMVARRGGRDRGRDGGLGPGRLQAGHRRRATGRRCAACVPSTTSPPALLGARPLTPPGQAIPLAFAACICVADDDPGRDARAPGGLRRASARARQGLPDGGPGRRRPAARRRAPVAPRDLSQRPVRAVLVDEAQCRPLDGRVPYIEIATL